MVKERVKQASLSEEKKDSDSGPSMNEWMFCTEKRYEKTPEGLASRFGPAINKAWCPRPSTPPEPSSSLQTNKQTNKQTEKNKVGAGEGSKGINSQL